MVPLFREADEPDPGPQEGHDQQSDWLPPDWVESVLEAPSPSAEVMEIQPGARWTPRPTAATAVSLGEIKLGEVEPRRFRLKLPSISSLRIRLSRWPRWNQLWVAALAVAALATPVVIGELNPGLTSVPVHAAVAPATPVTKVTSVPGGRPVRGAHRTRTARVAVRIRSSKRSRESQDTSTAAGSATRTDASSSPSSSTGSSSMPTGGKGGASPASGSSSGPAPSNPSPTQQPPASNPPPQQPPASSSPVQGAVNGAAGTVQPVIQKLP